MTHGRKGEFGVIGWKPQDVPDPQQEHAFTISKLRWSERDAASHRAMLDWYCQLLALRKSDPELGTRTLPKVMAAADPDGRWLWMTRGPYLIAAVLRGREIDVPVPAAPGSPPLLGAGCIPKPVTTGLLRFSEPGIIITRQHHEQPADIS